MNGMLSLDLSHKWAVIGGSTQGIGLATARALANLGANCVLVARNEQKLKAAVASLPLAKGNHHRYAVADYSSPNTLVPAIAQAMGGEKPVILVNNTGGPAGGAITDATPEQFLAAFQQHLICNHLLAQWIVPYMKQAGYGRIINVVSTSVKIPLNGLGVSNTIRGAVASWAKTMANELAQYGITVNNVLPGATETERLEAIINNKVNQSGTEKTDIIAKMQAEIPAKRFGMPEEIGSVIAFLATPAAGYVNGTSIPVDGGRTGSI